MWLYIDKQLKPVSLRTGITDGTNTEVTSGELQPGAEAVTGVILPNQNRTNAAAAANGNPFQQGGNRGFQGGGGGRGR